MSQSYHATQDAPSCTPPYPADSIRIDPQFNGPPGVGNGGIVCAMLADHCHGAFEAELRLPAPLDRPLTIEHSADGDVLLRDGDAVIACARDRALDLDVPPPPSWREAELAHAAALEAPHPFPCCFVCGPDRVDGDGLRVIAGSVPGRDGMVVTPWTAHAAFVDAETGAAAERFVWAALDCPGGSAALGGRDVPILLARFRGRIDRLPRAGERCMLVGWKISNDGRKHLVGSALIAADGAVLGRAESLWIEPRRHASGA